MRVFVTGASGHMGSAIVPELLGAGHQVVGLARSDSSAATLRSWGAEVQRGDLDDLDGLQAAARAADGVIHLAYRHDLMVSGDSAGAVATENAVIDAFGDALAQTGKPFVMTTGVMLFAQPELRDRPGTELDAAESDHGRIGAENTAIALADRGVRSVAVRLAPIVHSDLDVHGFVPQLIRMAREHGAAGYLGDGANRWPSGDTRDAAVVYRLALESARPGTRVHPLDETGVPFREIAEAIGRGLGVEADSVSPEDAPERFGFMAPFVGLDDWASSELTREWLGWAPTRPGLIADIDSGHYFSA